MSDMLFTIQEKIFSALTEKNFDGCEKILQPQPPLSVEQRLIIYHDSMVNALITTLRDTYTVCCQLVGENFFNAMAQLYVKKTPSYSPNILDYGETFAKFIANFPPAAELPYLADMAKLEWAFHCALHGKDNSPSNLIELNTIAEIEYFQIILHLPEHATLLESPYPIQKIWQMHQPDGSLEEPIDLNTGGIKLLIWRQNMDTKIDALDDNEWFLLQALKNAIPLENIFNQCSKLNIISTLSKLVAAGMITKFTVDAYAKY